VAAGGGRQLFMASTALRKYLPSAALAAAEEKAKRRVSLVDNAWRGGGLAPSLSSRRAACAAKT